MSFKAALCLLAMLQLSSASLDAGMRSFIDGIFAELGAKDQLTPLTFHTYNGFDKTDKLSLTQGGNTAEGYKLHQSAVTVLAAYDQVLKSSYNETIKNLMAKQYEVPELYCPKHNYKYYKCDDTYPYRNLDGACNNLYVPWWGKRETPYERILAPEYADGVNAPRVRGVKKPLPNPREVAMKIHSARRTFPETTQFLTFFGQHIDHDLVLTTRSTYKNGDEKNCACGTRDQECFNVPIPYEDYYNPDQKCFPFARSSAALKNFDCKFSYREQLNAVTHWLDLSNIYGSSTDTNKKLRTFKYGLLKTSVNPVNGHPDLPLSNKASCEHKKMGQSCYMGGDVRMEDNHYLTIFARIFVREHNRIAKDLYKHNYGWSDERLFQEARRINIAEYQHVVYYEFLPVLLGSAAMRRWKLNPTPHTSYFKGYDKNINPQVKNCKSNLRMKDFWLNFLISPCFCLSFRHCRWSLWSCSCQQVPLRLRQPIQLTRQLHNPVHPLLAHLLRRLLSAWSLPRPFILLHAGHQRLHEQLPVRWHDQELQETVAGHFEHSARP